VPRATLLIVLSLIGAVPAGAELHADMRAAVRELKGALRHLRAAPHDYRGHRRTAEEELRKAIEEIRLGIAAVTARDEASGE
jgi:hypothetical protein